MVWAGHSKATNPAPGCPISLALTFLLTLGLSLKKSLMGTLAANHAMFLSKEFCSSALRPWQAGNRQGSGRGQLDLHPLVHRPYLSFSQKTKKTPIQQQQQQAKQTKKTKNTNQQTKQPIKKRKIPADLEI